MTQPCFSVTVEDYELRTGIDVAQAMEPTVQVWLNDIAGLICLYLGDCADEVAAAYPDMLTALACSHVLVQSSRPAPGVRSESVGSTNVTYDTDRLADTVPFGLTNDEQNVLNQLLVVVCPDQAVDSGGGVGQLGVTWGGQPDRGWASEVDVWVVSR